MRKIIICILIYMLVFTTVVGAMSSINLPMKSKGKENADRSYSHTILGEYFTLTTCIPCKYSHKALQNLYWGGYHPFYYITMVYDDDIGNKKADQRHDELGVTSSPCVVWDNGYLKDAGSKEDIEKDMAVYNNSIRACGNRTVKDIELNLDVDWLGATNPNPPNNVTDIPVETNLSWQITAMNINVTVDSNEAGQYNGHLHVYVTELNSSYWDDKWGKPYTFAFLDYGYHGDVTISGGGTWNNFSEWDGADHQNGYGEYYDEIYQDNCMVIASIFDKNHDDDADDAVGFLAGVGTEPKTLDLYFGNTTPPPQVLWNSSGKQYNPPGNLSFNTTYYWKIDVWDHQGNPKYGNIWNFTTRGNTAPYFYGNPTPMNDSFNVIINTSLSWNCADLEFDPVKYDIYLGKNDPALMQLVSQNQTNKTYKPIGNLDFDTRYYWKIRAWDLYDFYNDSAIWTFKTQINLPPNPPSDPIPEDGSTNADVWVNLSWNGTDPNPGDWLKYDVYFDDVDPPTMVSPNQTKNWWVVPYELTKYKTYYWKVVAWDSGKPPLSAVNKTWTFSPGEPYPPTDPIIDGPPKGGPGVIYDFTFVSTDLNEQNIRYNIDWGDGKTEVTNYYPSGFIVTRNHTWEKQGTFIIKARAQDEGGKLSNNTSKFTFKVPKSKVLTNSIFLRFSEQFRDIFPILRYLLKILG